MSSKIKKNESVTSRAARRQTYALFLVLLLGALASDRDGAMAADPAAGGNVAAAFARPDGSPSIAAFNPDQTIIAQAIALGFTVRAEQDQLGARHSVLQLIPPSGMDRMSELLLLQRRFPSIRFGLVH